MKNSIILMSLLFLIFSSNAVLAQEFQIKMKPNSALPEIKIIATGDKTSYNHAKADLDHWDVEVRGKISSLLSSNYRLEIAKIRYGNKSSSNQYYKDIPVSGEKRSLTGNNGKKWEAHTITMDSFGDLQPFIDHCNGAVDKDIENGKTLTQALNTTRNFTWTNDQTPYQATLMISESTNDDYLSDQDSTNLAVHVKCVATGYVKPLPTASNGLTLVSGITKSSLTILEHSSRFNGNCKVTLSGVIETNLPNTTVKFQYEHTNGKLSDIKTVNTDHAKVAMFSNTYDVDNNPYDDEAGSIRIVGVSHAFKSAWKTYTMRCEDVATNSLQAETPPELALNIKVKSKEMQSGQICPVDVILHGTIDAGSSIQGNAVFIGNDDFKSDRIAYDLHQGGRKHLFAVRTLEWPSTINELHIQNDGPAALKKVTITQGFSLINEDDKLVAVLPQQTHTFSCTYPTVNPSLPAPTTDLAVQSMPDHSAQMPAKISNDKSSSSKLKIRKLGQDVEVRNSKTPIAIELQSNEKPDIYLSSLDVYAPQTAVGKTTLMAEHAISRNNGICEFQFQVSIANASSVNLSTPTGRYIVKNNGKQVIDKAVQLIPGNSVSSVGKIWLSSGINNINVIADPKNTENESNEKNNTINKKYKVIGSCDDNVEKSLKRNIKNEGIGKKKLERGNEQKEPLKLKINKNIKAN
jgi:hypothetical protein